MEADYPLSRDALYQKLKNHNIHARRYFYPLISDFPMYRGLPSAHRDNLPKKWLKDNRQGGISASAESRCGGRLSRALTSPKACPPRKHLVNVEYLEEITESALEEDQIRIVHGLDPQLQLLDGNGSRKFTIHVIRV